MTKVAFDGIQSISHRPMRGFDIRTWHSFRVEMAGAPGATGPIVAFREDSAALPEALRAKKATGPGVGLECADSISELAIPPNFDPLGPTLRGAALQLATPGAKMMLRSLSVGANADIAEQVRHLPSAHAPGGPIYPSFCARLRAAHFPPASIVVRRWTSAFGHGRTFVIYVGQFAKAFQLLEADTSQRGDAVRAIARGIANKPDNRPRMRKSLTAV